MRFMCGSTGGPRHSVPLGWASKYLPAHNLIHGVGYGTMLPTPVLHAMLYGIVHQPTVYHLIVLLRGGHA